MVLWGEMPCNASPYISAQLLFVFICPSPAVKSCLFDRTPSHSFLNHSCCSASRGRWHRREQIKAQTEEWMEMRSYYVRYGRHCNARREIRARTTWHAPERKDYKGQMLLPFMMMTIIITINIIVTAIIDKKSKQQMIMLTKMPVMMIKMAIQVDLASTRHIAVTCGKRPPVGKSLQGEMLPSINSRVAWLAGWSVSYVAKRD